jgi:hypothetical protein
MGLRLLTKIQTTRTHTMNRARDSLMNKRVGARILCTQTKILIVALLLSYSLYFIPSSCFCTMGLLTYCINTGQQHNVPLNKYYDTCGQENKYGESSSSAPSPPPAATPRTERAGSSINPLVVDTSPTPKASKAMYVPSQVNPLTKVELAPTDWEARKAHARTESL